MAVRGTPSIELSRLASRYPFLPGAEDVMASVVPSLREIVEGPLYAEAREIARVGVKRAAEEPSSPAPQPAQEVSSAETAFLSFQYARILLAMPHLPQALVRRWCLYQAKSAWREFGRPDAEVTELVEIAELLGMRGRVVEGPGRDRIAFSVPSYVHMATPVREVDFRLARQEVQNGEVMVMRDRAARLLQEAVRLHLMSLPPIHLQPAVVELVSAREGDFLQEVARLTPSGSSLLAGGFDPLLFPPCIKEMQAMMSRGENLSHFGRFTLAAYLNRVGASSEYIVDSFRGAPDFDEEITRYQVEHVTAHDENKGYTPPECATIRTNGLCFMERDELRPSLCADPNLRHPLNYYYTRKKGKGSATHAASPAISKGTPKQ
jgi:DNA primase large subunit